MTTQTIFIVESRDCILSPELQFFTKPKEDKVAITMAAHNHFTDRTMAERAAARFITPKFKVKEYRV